MLVLVFTLLVEEEVVVLTPPEGLLVVEEEKVEVLTPLGGRLLVPAILRMRAAMEFQFHQVLLVLQVQVISNVANGAVLSASAIR